MPTAARSTRCPRRAAFAEFERSLISARTKEGLERARREGRPTLTQAQVEHARRLRMTGMSVTEIARLLDKPRSTVHRAMTSEAYPARV